jgi:hypothetical protein
MQGRRVYAEGNKPLCTQVGDYGKDTHGNWWIWVPDTNIVCDLPQRTSDGKGWTIEEHEDGTITTSPSINFPHHWHGYLTKGEWVSC